MFNNSVYVNKTNNTLNINAVSGTLVKTHKDSFFLRFHITSRTADNLFSEKPKIPRVYNCDEDKPVAVIQTMLCGDGEILAEVMYKKDFDKLFDNTEVDNNANKTGGYQ